MYRIGFTPKIFEYFHFSTFESEITKTRNPLTKLKTKYSNGGGGSTCRCNYAKFNILSICYAWCCKLLTDPTLQEEESKIIEFTFNVRQQ